MHHIAYETLWRPRKAVHSNQWGTRCLECEGSALMSRVWNLCNGQAIAAQDAFASQHQEDLIKSLSETPLTSRYYDIEGFKGALNRDPTVPRGVRRKLQPGIWGHVSADGVPGMSSHLPWNEGWSQAGIKMRKVDSFHEYHTAEHYLFSCFFLLLFLYFIRII